MVSQAHSPRTELNWKPEVLHWQCLADRQDYAFAEDTRLERFCVFTTHDHGNVGIGGRNEDPSLLRANRHYEGLG